MSTTRDAQGLMTAGLTSILVYGTPLWLALTALAPAPAPVMVRPSLSPGFEVGLSEETLTALQAQLADIESGEASESPEETVSSEAMAPAPEAEDAPEEPRANPRAKTRRDAMSPKKARTPKPKTSPEPVAAPSTPERTVVDASKEPTPSSRVVVTPRTDRKAAAPASPAEATQALIHSVRSGQSSASKKKDCKVFYPEVNKVDDTHFVVNRSIVEYYTSSLERFNTLGWSRAWRGKDGQKGWEIRGFGCRSPLWKGGLRSGDAVQSINGKKTNNIVQLFFLYPKMKRFNDFEVKLVRKGKPLTLHYSMVDS